MDFWGRQALFIKHPSQYFWGNRQLSLFIEGLLIWHFLASFVSLIFRQSQVGYTIWGENITDLLCPVNFNDILPWRKILHGWCYRHLPTKLCMITGQKLCWRKWMITMRLSGWSKSSQGPDHCTRNRWKFISLCYYAKRFTETYVHTFLHGSTGSGWHRWVQYIHLPTKCWRADHLSNLP